MASFLPRDSVRWRHKIPKSTMPALMITALRMRGGSEDDHEHDPEDMDAYAD
jgi:hypothetical protein